MLRPHRSHGGRPRRLRPGPDLVRRAAANLLGGPRPDPGDAAGERRRLPVPLGALLDDRRPAGGGARLEGALRDGSRPGRPRPDHDRARRGRAVLLRRDLPPAVSGPESRAATAESAAPASPARSAPASRAEIDPQGRPAPVGRPALGTRCPRPHAGIGRANGGMQPGLRLPASAPAGAAQPLRCAGASARRRRRRPGASSAARARTGGRPVARSCCRAVGSSRHRGRRRRRSRSAAGRARERPSLRSRGRAPPRSRSGRAC